MENPSKDNPNIKISWEEFREAGMLFAINQFLNHFGMSITVEVFENDPSKVTSVYPTRCSSRGFNDDSQDKGYSRTAKYLSENIKDILKESEDGSE